MLKEGIRSLHPAYFSLVMATGIIAIASRQQGLDVVSLALFYIALLAYVVLWLLTLARLAVYPARVWQDLSSHALGPGYFTLVAGTCVLGSALIILFGSYQAAFGLWLLGIFLWVVIMYTFFTAVVVHPDKPALKDGINGAWLIAAVATQSISVLGTLVSDGYPRHQELLLFTALCFYLLGCMLYLNIIVLIFYRLTFLELKAEALTPPYWINMGALAITTLAGANLLLNQSGWPLLQEMLPFIRGFTLFFWSAGSWWIPLLVILGFWRHVNQHVPLEYSPLYWGMVFPLGMYTVSTFQLARAIGLDFLFALPHVFIYITLAVWLAVFTGFFWSLAQKRLGRGRD